MIINFRGSRGYGLKMFNSLIGNVGINDVEDCGELTLKAIERFSFIDPKKVFVSGLSYGGCLAGNLIGNLKYKHIFRAANARNPIFDFIYMSKASDEPDWVTSCVLNKEFDYILSEEEIQ